MYLIQILLPVPKSGGTSIEKPLSALHRTLVDHFGGLTVSTRTPAEGKWLAGGKEEQDDIIILEVMADEIDRGWWGTLRKRLEADLKQDQIVIRSHPIDRL